MKQDKEIIEKILNSDEDGLNEKIKKEIEEEEKLEQENLEKEKALYNKEDFNYNDKNLKKSKYFSQLEKEANIYLKSERIPDIDKPRTNLNNIHKPIIKLLIVFVIAMIFVKTMQPLKNYEDIEGLWLDDKNIYYEIYDERLEMNLGNEATKFYEGQITNLVKTEDGYIILAKGIKYEENQQGELIATSKENIVLTIKNYTKELQVKMTANLGGQDFEIVRCDDTKKTERIIDSTK